MSSHAMIYSTKESLELLDEIIEQGTGLTEWEEKFVDSVSGQEKLSYKQREIISKIHEARCR